MKWLLMLFLASNVMAYEPYESYEYKTLPKTESLRYNYSTGKSEYATQDETLKYNWSTGKSSYEKPSSTLKYNWSTGGYEYAD